MSLPNPSQMLPPLHMLNNLQDASGTSHTSLMPLQLNNSQGSLQLSEINHQVIIESTETVVETEEQVTETVVETKEQVTETALEGQEQVTEVEIDLNEITDHERKKNAEWFMGKPAKTPERYMRIRNHIIQCWKNNRPNYLTKTAGRKNLKDAGDVNAVGRIHTYLENNRIINTNCSAPVAIKKRAYTRTHRLSEDGSTHKKSKKMPGYYWADVDSEGEENLTKVARNNIIRGDGTSRPKRTIKKPETFYDESMNDSGFIDDAFRLIPVSFYPKASHAPFSVTITSNALLVMEFHSHLASAEIIGLLGGRFNQNETSGEKELEVVYVFPCRSTSTGTQCEMDPDSEMEAREVFEKKGLKVVGWYHSHPTFDPEPSIRDIQNQLSYQYLFRDETSGVEPFIGTIITPYNASLSEKSQFQFFHVGDRWSPDKTYRLPFACFKKIVQCKQVSPDMLDILKNLLRQYRTYDKKIDLNSSYGTMTRLEKLLRSLKSHLFMSAEENANFLIEVNKMIQSLYLDSKQQETSTQEKKEEDDVIHSLAI
ncbi:hypothetical protein EDC96DRAFT_517092 [Choanephora cucurbitarum]|nr:hypothetical protein EDC96DRAFT_517092 [Choanephora cucurbitarum]